MAIDEITTGRVLIVEYERLKEEQKIRIGFRDNLIYATLVALAGVIAAATQSSSGVRLLLLLPPISVLLGWTYLVNDEKVSAIGGYIRYDIAPRLASLDSVEAPVFGWETKHRSDLRRRSRKFLQLGVDLATFCAVPLVAIAIFVINSHSTPVLYVIAAVESLGITGLAAQFFVYAEIGGKAGDLPEPISRPRSGAPRTSVSGEVPGEVGEN